MVYTLVDRICPSPHVEFLCGKQTSFYCTDNSFHFVSVSYSAQVFTQHLSVEAGSRAVSGSKSGSYRLECVFLCDLGLGLFVMSYIQGD